MRSRVVLELAIAVVLVGVLGASRSAPGQPATLRGQVTSAATGRPLPRANVTVQGMSKGTTTDTTGTYVLQHVPSGQRTVRISYVGYRSQTRTVALAPGDTERLDVALSPVPLDVGEVTVKRRHETRGLRTHEVGRAELERLPASFGDDLFRSLSVLPGVTTTSDYSSQLHVRGGDPSQTLVRLDGTTVYKPTHFFGFFSMFNPDAIGSVTLHKGPYPVEYGGRLGSVVDVKSRTGNQDHGGGGTLSLTASRAYAVGPLGGQSASAGSYLVAVRRSTFEPVLSVLQTVDTEGIPRDLTFYDANVHLTLTPSPDDELSLALYGARNALDLHLHQDWAQFDIDYENQGLNAEWNHRFGPDLFASVSLLGSRYHTTPLIKAGSARFEEENGIAELGFDADLRWMEPDAHTVNGGLRTSVVRFQLRNDEIARDRERRGGWNRQVSGITTEAYVQDTYRPTSRWTLRSGLRGLYYQRGDVWRLAPRLSVEYRPARAVQLQAAYGRNHQFRVIDTDSRLPGFDTWLIADEGVPPASGHQGSTGATVRLDERWRLEVAGYYRVMDDLFELKPWLASYRLANRPHSQRYRIGEGRAYGGELYVRRQNAPVTGFLSYTVGRTERTFPHPAGFIEARSHVANHDRTHEVEVAARWHLAEAWTLTSHFTYKTGRPYTPNAEDPILDHPFPSQSRRIPRRINSARLPAYHRLDLGIEHTGRLFGGIRYNLSANVVNVYSRRNVWLHNFERRNGERVRDDIYQLPVPIPYISLSLHY